MHPQGISVPGQRTHIRDREVSSRHKKGTCMFFWPAKKKGKKKGGGGGPIGAFALCKPAVLANRPDLHRGTDRLNRPKH